MDDHRFVFLAGPHRSGTDIREPEPVMRGVFEFLELDPIPPSEPVDLAVLVERRRV